MTISSIGVGSKLDLAGLLTNLETAESQPLKALEAKAKSYTSKLSAYGSVQGALSALQATATKLSTNGWKTFFRALGNDDTQGPAAAKYIKDTLKATKVFVIDDASEYGKGLADIVRNDLGSTVVGNDTIQQKQTDFSASVTKVTSSAADSLFFGGYSPEAAPLIKQLRDASWKGTFVVADGVKDPGFIEGAGKAAEGTIITCPCIPAEDPAVAEFASAFADANNGQAPGTYSAEAYDAANVFLSGLADGAGDRAAMLDWVNNYDEPGVTKRVSFDDKGEVADIHVYAYKVEGGEIVSDSEIE
jgi:branched-chain amino acid transport system substrate-binding protein